MEAYLFEVPEAVIYRPRIEDNLLLRHKHLQRKIEALKVRHLKEEVKYNQPSPTINLRSQKLAALREKKDQSLSRIDRTQEIFRNSRFFPKSVTISLESLNNPQFIKKKAYLKLPLSNTSFSDANINSPISFPSLKSAFEAPTLTNEPLPADISQRNELLLTLRQSAFSRGFHSEPQEPPSLSFHSRTERWLKLKSEKLKALKESVSEKRIEGCTFQPKLLNKSGFFMNHSERFMSAETSYSEIYLKKKLLRSKPVSSSRSQRTLSQGTRLQDVIGGERYGCKNYENQRYVSLCPVNYEVGYGRTSGSQILEKAKPMINYKALKCLA